MGDPIEARGETIDPLARELETFNANRERLLASDRGRFVLIQGDQVLGTFTNEREAMFMANFEFRGEVPVLVARIEEPIPEPDDSDDGIEIAFSTGYRAQWEREHGESIEPSGTLFELNGEWNPHPGVNPQEPAQEV